MRIFLDRIIFTNVLVCAVCINLGCGYVHKPTSDSTPFQEEALQPTPTHPSPDVGKVIVDEGCNIPSVTRLHVFRSHETRWKSETGEKIKVVITDYNSSQPFYYDQKPLTPMMNQVSFGGTLKLMWLSEIRSGRKIFAYTMYSRKKKIETAGSQNANGWNDQMFPYVCVDTDGDGIFETVLTTSELLVPAWASKN